LRTGFRFCALTVAEDDGVASRLMSVSGG